jgi:hypothetical protein
MEETILYQILQQVAQMTSIQLLTKKKRLAYSNCTSLFINTF